MVSLFLENVRNRTWNEQGWPEIWPEYAVSKLAINAYSRVLARRYYGPRLSVNCFCPGFTRTYVNDRRQRKFQTGRGGFYHRRSCLVSSGKSYHRKFLYMFREGQETCFQTVKNLFSKYI